MNAADIEKLQRAGFITPEQQRAILVHFQLDRERSKLLVILLTLGALLVSAGIILLIAANWDAIPHLVKLGVGASLLVLMHVLGYVYGRGQRGIALAETFHLIGSGLFLANIALVGQVYHSSAPVSHALLLWLAGIAPLAWILRSRAQQIVTLVGFTIWLMLEVNRAPSPIFFGGEQRQFLFYALVGLVFAGFGLLLTRTRFVELAGPTEALGLLYWHLASYPITLGFFYAAGPIRASALALCGGVGLLAVVLLLASAVRGPWLESKQWRWTWVILLSLLAGCALAALRLHGEYAWSADFPHVGWHWLATLVLFVFCLIQVQIGILRGNAWLVNVAMASIGIHSATAYFQLFGSMRTTGLMFLVGGVFLIVMAIYLERKRRSFLKRLHRPAIPLPPPSSALPSQSAS
jgi:uncharacterized membrane protein